MSEIEIEPSVEFDRGSSGYLVRYPDKRFGYDVIQIPEGTVVEWEQNPGLMKDALIRIFRFRREQQESK